MRMTEVRVVCGIAMMNHDQGRGKQDRVACFAVIPRVSKCR